MTVFVTLSISLVDYLFSGLLDYFDISRFVEFSGCRLVVWCQ